jgi:hypothetical protein
MAIGKEAAPPSPPATAPPRRLGPLTSRAAAAARLLRRLALAIERGEITAETLGL